MEKIVIDLTNFTDREDQLNLLAMFIVNRAAMYDGTKYNRIAVELSDDAISCTAYHFLTIISNYNKIPIYVNWKARAARYVNHKALRFRPQFWLEWIKKKEDTLYLDCVSTTTFELSHDVPKIFSGFSKQEIEEIAEKLYGWQDDLQSYKEWKKQLKKELKNARNNSKREG